MIGNGCVLFPIKNEVRVLRPREERTVMRVLGDAENKRAGEGKVGDSDVLKIGGIEECTDWCLAYTATGKVSGVVFNEMRSCRSVAV